jgi:hypothetical protein
MRYGTSQNSWYICPAKLNGGARGRGVNRQAAALEDRLRRRASGGNYPVIPVPGSAAWVRSAPAESTI